MKNPVSNHGPLLLAITTTALLSGVTGCSTTGDRISESVSSLSQAVVVPRQHLEAIDPQDQLFYTYWEKDFGLGTAVMDLEPQGYTAIVDYTSVTGITPNFVVGKGRKPCWGEVINWHVDENLAVHDFGAYGWQRAPLVEYYIGRDGGAAVGEYSTSRGRYRLHVAQKNQANILNPDNDPALPQKFLQFNCESLDGAVTKAGPVDLSEHYQAWDALMAAWWLTQTDLFSQGWRWFPLSQADYCVVGTEIYGATTGNASVSNIAFEERIATEPLIQSVSNSGTGNGSLTYRVMSTVAWSIASDTIPSWATVSPTTGQPGLTAMTVVVAPDVTPDERRASFEFDTSGLAPFAVAELVQFHEGEGWTPTAAGGGSFFQITPSGDWSAASSAPEWLSVTPNQGSSGTYTLSASATPNTGVASRSATLTITGGGATQTIHVVQAPVSFYADPMLITVEAPGATQSLHIYSNVSSWSASVTNGESWLSVNAGSGSGGGNGTVSLVVSPNTTGHDRSATITIEGDGAPTRAVTVIQRKGLPAGWTPQSFGSELLGWYVARPDQVLPQGGSTVQRWVDLSGHGNDVIQNNVVGQPQYQAQGWAGDQPTLYFNGNDILVANWSAPAPAGTDMPITVMAVIQPTAFTQGKVASFWDPNGEGWLPVGVNVANGRLLPDMSRLHSLADVQTFAAPHDLGYRRSTDPVTAAEHVVVWRYAPASQQISVTVDGTMTTSSSIPPIGALPSMPFIVGAGSLNPNLLFSGNISELAVVGGTVSDADVQNLTQWAQLQWHGLPAQGSTDPCLDSNGRPIAQTGIRCDDGNTSTYGDQCVSGTCVGTVPPSGAPTALSPTAWYHASPQDVALRDGGVETWFDRTANHLDLSTGFYFGRPGFTSGGWSSGKDTLSFAGHHVLTRRAWTGAPAGTDSAFTVLAVMKQAAGTATQSDGLAGFWNAYGAGRIGCDLRTSGSATVLDLFRVAGSGATQEYQGTADLGSGKHVLAWRYSTGHMQLAIDGMNTQNDVPVVDPLNPDLFLVGTDSAFANTLLKAELAELVVVPRSITDPELAAYDSYVVNEWGL